MGYSANKSILPKELVELLQKPESVKVVTTLNADGTPYAAINHSVTTFDGETVIFCEELEKSTSNKNLVRSIWFDKPLSVSVAEGETSFYIQAKPHRCLITGRLFKEMLLRIRDRGGPDADIATVWEIHPVSVSKTSPKILRVEQEHVYPYFGQHLDRASIKK